MPNNGFFGFSAPPSKIAHPDDLPEHPTLWDDEFEDFQLNSKWTVQNKGANDVVSISSGWLGYYAPAKGDVSALFGIEQVAPQGTWTFAVKYAFEGYALNFVGPQIWVRDSISGRIVSLGTLFHSSHGYFCPFIFHQSNFTTYIGENSVNAWVMAQKGYLSLVYDGTNLNCFHSIDGANYMYIIGEAKTAYLNATPTHIGIGGYHQNQTLYVSYDWFRRTA